jgi:hypothetical protein
MINKKKNQKPIEIDAHFRYKCPNTNCGCTHWLTFKETQTKNFKVVCDCGSIFKPKQIATIKIKYYQPIEPVIETNNPVIVTEPKIEPPKQEPQIPEKMLAICSKTLIDYGFTQKEAHNLLRQSFILNPTDSAFDLINYTLNMLGNIDDSNS